MVKQFLIIIILFFVIPLQAAINLREYPDRQAPVVLSVNRLDRFVPFHKKDHWYKVGDKYTGKVGWLEVVEMNAKDPRWEQQLADVAKLFPIQDKGHLGRSVSEAATKNELQHAIDNIRRQQSSMQQEMQAVIKMMLEKNKVAQ